MAFYLTLFSPGPLCLPFPRVQNPLVLTLLAKATEAIYLSQKENDLRRASSKGIEGPFALNHHLIVLRALPYLHIRSFIVRHREKVSTERQCRSSFWPMLIRSPFCGKEPGLLPLGVSAYSVASSSRLRRPSVLCVLTGRILEKLLASEKKKTDLLKFHFALPVTVISARPSLALTS